MRWLILIALLLVAPPAAIAGTVGRHRTPDPRSMVLQPGDLPAMFDRADGHYVSNTLLDEEAATHKDFAKLGRLTGYYTAYTAIALGGLTAVTSFASIYKLGSGAHDSLVQSVAEAKQHGGLVLEPNARLAPLGSDARLYLQRVRQDGTKVDFFTLVWRHGHVFAEVMGAGVSGTVDPVQVIALAKKQDGHIDRILG